MTEKRINDFITALDKSRLFIEADKTDNSIVKGVTFNSKLVQEGYLFICKGAHFKREYLEEAVSRGAIAYVSEIDYEVDGVGAVLVKDVRSSMNVIAETFYGKPDELIDLVGITGTKGKTSAAYFLRYIFNKYMAATGGKEVAFCSGVENYDGVMAEESHLTTPEKLELMHYISNAVDSGISHMVMEVSSQALKYGRVSGIHYKVGCLINIGEDHISPVEHESMEDYLASKLLLFKQCDSVCVNLDCNYQEEIRNASSAVNKVIYFSKTDDKSDVYAYNIKSDEGRVSFNVKIRNDVGIEETLHIEMAAFSTINVENALAAISIAVAMGVPSECIKSGLKEATVPGRLEVVKSSDGRKTVIVDFAHNKLSFETLFEKLNDEFPGRDYIIVFGAPGMKAPGRRKELGEIAGEYAKLSIITEDDPGEESVEKICLEIAEYVNRVNGNYEIVLDRGAAIKHALELADENTIVIVAGKGREKWIKRGLEYVEIPSDVEYVNEYINL